MSEALTSIFFSNTFYPLSDEHSLSNRELFFTLDIVYNLIVNFCECLLIFVSICHLSFLHVKNVKNLVFYELLHKNQ